MSHALKQVFNKDKTFRPKRKFEPGTQRFELHKKAQASLNAGLDLKVAVQLPPGEEQNDWVAVHVVDFFNRINLIYGTISDYCTEQSCPVMSGGPKYEYRWQDEHKYRKPTALSAPQYMNLLMDWIEVQINNEDIFPTNVGEFSSGGSGGEGGRCRAFCFEPSGPISGPGDAVAQVTLAAELFPFVLLRGWQCSKLFRALEKLQSFSGVLKYPELYQIPFGVLATSRKAQLSLGSENKRLLLEKSISDMTLEYFMLDVVS